MKKLIAGALLLGIGFCLPHRTSVTALPAPRGPVHHLASRDTYYLLSYFSSRAPNGWIGWTPGAEVHRTKGIKTADGSVAISDGKHSAIVPAALLTRDIETADALRLADQAMQDQAEFAVAAIRAESRAREIAEQVALASNIEHANAMQIAASTIGTFNSRLGASAYPASGGSSVSGYNSYYAYHPVGDDGVAGTRVPAAAVVSTATGVTPTAPDEAATAALTERLYSNGAKLGIPEGTLRQMALDVSHSDIVRAYQ